MFLVFKFLPQKKNRIIVVNTIIIILFCVVNNIASTWKKVYEHSNEKIVYLLVVVWNTSRFNKLKIIMFVTSYVSIYLFIYHTISFIVVYLGIVVRVWLKTYTCHWKWIIRQRDCGIGGEFPHHDIEHDWKVGWFEIHETKQLTKNKL